jgi:tetratricopeptide (TPR) repeat protein
MDQSPDSALIKLQTIDGNKLIRQGDKALFSLLYSQALDKNYVDVCNDSIINIAVSWYENTNDVHYKMLSYYYLAQVKFNKGDVVNALLAVMESEKYAVELNDYYYLSMIYRTMSRIYAKSYNRTKKIQYAKLALENIEKTEKSAHKLYAKLLLADSYASNKQFLKADSLYRLVLETSPNSDKYLINFTHKNYSYLLLSNNLYQRAKEQINMYINSGDSTIIDSQDFCNLAEIYSEEKNFSEAKKLLDKASNMIKTQRDSLSWFHANYKYNMRIPNVVMANEYIQKYLDVYNEIVDYNLEFSISNALASIMESKKIEATKEMTQVSRQNNLLIAILVITIILIILAFLYYRENSRKQSIYQDSIITDLAQLKEENDNNRNDISEARRLMYEIIQGNVKGIENLCDIYSDAQISNKYKQALLDKLKSIINSFNTPQVIQSLKDAVNNNHNNIIERIEKSNLKFDFDDVILIVYSYAGLSARSICLILGMDLKQVYNKKYRLKQKIAKALGEDLKL